MGGLAIAMIIVGLLLGFAAYYGYQSKYRVGGGGGDMKIAFSKHDDTD